MNKQDLTYGLPEPRKITQHGIVFGHFQSERFNLHLHERTAITPREKEAVASIPYRQGVVDMSKLLGHRVYDNREITYVFYRFGVEKSVAPSVKRINRVSHTARDFQTTIENLLLINFDQELHDTYEPDFIYTGKCKEVLVTDEYHKNRLRVEIRFDLHPFKFDRHMESEDMFDSFNFDIDAFHDGLRYSVTAGQVIRVYNSSQKVVLPSVVGVPLINRSQRSPSVGNALKLEQGMNELVAQGSGTVQLDWRKERI